MKWKISIPTKEQILKIHDGRKLLKNQIEISQVDNKQSNS